ncbi:MAG: glycoside hydrolase family 127 protein [Bacteroides sp.]|nr:glycoside hydrolase family 127 protein [Bacteroides sp.]
MNDFLNRLNHCAAYVMLGIALSFSHAADAQSKLYPDLFDLSEVSLLPGRFADAQNLNVETLLKYDVDRLLAPYLKGAGLQPKAESFPCWDGLDGHVGGHYLTALAIHYASTGNHQLKERMDYMLSELKRCQKANGDGYVGGVPDGKTLYDRLKKGDVRAIKDYWVPWYNLHKTFAGLRDAWLYAGNEEAKQMFLDFCDWGLDVISGIDDKKMEEMLNKEFGGMNEIYADAFQITGNKKYLDAAKRFSHHLILDSMAKGIDNLDNKHANTQVPKIVGYERIALLDPTDTQFSDAAKFFWETVTGNRTLSIGGNSRREHFAAADDYRSYMDEREGPETCNTNNMLKLTENLFRANPESRYADFYERAVFNHILSSQHPGHGGYVYFTSARPAHYRVYSAPNAAMWCCVGTGMENHGKYGEFIYSRSNDSLRVNLFIPSKLQRRDNGVAIVQTTDFPNGEKTTLRIECKKNTEFPLLVRRPEWCEGFSISVNKEKVNTEYVNGYAVINRKWKNGDEVEVSLPMQFRFEEAPKVGEYVSILRGPIVMAARVKTDDITNYVADDSRWAHIAHGKLISIFDTPIIIGNREDVLKKLNDLNPVGDMKYRLEGIFDKSDAKMELEPFSGIHDTRYMMYWLSMTPEKYDQWQRLEREEEQLRLALDERTVDAINTGEQQPEADHYLNSKNSRVGNFNGEAWRNASSSGFFTFRMNTQGNNNLALRVRYYGKEEGNKTFDILVNDSVIASENTSGKWNEDKFMEVEYPIPSGIANEDNTFDVTFRPQKDSSTGGIYHIRLVKN